MNLPDSTSRVDPAQSTDPTPRGAPRRDTARPADGTDAAAMGAMFARAFADDPVWTFMCRSRVEKFPTIAPPFFATEVRRHLRMDAAWTVPGCSSGALWAPPDRWRTTPGDLVRWAPSALRVFGWRLPVSVVTLEKAEKLHPREPHWYLALLGTDPDRQGKGLGSAALQPVLDRCDAEGQPAYLESSKEHNVPFYERHGFEVTGTVDLGPRGSGPRLWLMWREPRPPSER